MADGSSIKFHFRLMGDKNSPTILLLHGFIGSSEDWKPEITEPLLDSGYRVLAVDLPGHGRTEAADDNDYDMAACAAGLVRLLDEIGPDRAHLLGYSMGGRLALFMAVNYPDRWPKVILESASPGLDSEEERQNRVRADAALARRIQMEPPAEFLADWYAQPLFASLSACPDKLQQLIAERSGYSVDGLRLSLERMGTGVQPSLWDELERIKSPLLLIVGEKDSKFREIGSEIDRRCPDATLEVAADAGHNVHLEQPEQFVRAVVEFLQR